MRYVTIAATPEDGWFHPLDRHLSEDESIRRRAIHRVELLDDGTVVMLAEAAGDLDRLRTTLDDSPHVLEFSVSGDREGFSYSHFEPNDLVRELMLQRRASELVVQMPLTYREDGAMVATYVGEPGAFREALDVASAGVDVEVLETGDTARL